MLNSYFDNINLYLEKYNLLFFNVPKVASSSIWSICAQLETGFDTQSKDQIRSIKIPSIKSSEIDRHPDVQKIAFVRNPFDRIVSCYCNKITKKDFQFMTVNGLNENTSFEQFVDYICEIPDSNSDRHFRSQFTYIFDHNANLIANYIGRFESFNQDFEEIIKRFQLPSIEIPHWNKESKKHYSEFYTDAIVEKLKKRYEIDLLLFGYEFNKPLNPLKRGDWKQELPLKMQIEILKTKSQKLLRVVKHKEKYDDLPNGMKGFLIRKYKQYFTNYFD